MSCSFAGTVLNLKFRFYQQILIEKNDPSKSQLVERSRWDISQFIFKIFQNDVCGTAVSWFLRYLGVPSDDEKVVLDEF